ncbi:MAG: hypothetical protein Tp178DCM178821_30 [Prokaryotic dsDNA virus sp.]|nr:MAG: hypothetical protein Tp178DCM178821_30 [Prokaryotic dsDNA virus sp.]|tara:strand:+ start:7338 stop:7949 length:612 start_codon:yes stop_codon:yes gene_type:complete
MKITINNKGKKESFDLIEKWEDVTLEKWLKLIEIKTDKKAVEAIENISTLSNIPKDLIRQLSVSAVAEIMKNISKMQVEASSNLVNIIEVDGREYGFIPNLDHITIGEFADIEMFIKNGLEKHMPEIMAVLYRPVISKKNEAYTIIAYDGEITLRAEEFKKMKAEQVQSALVFFYNLGNELLKTSQLYLMEEAKRLLKSNKTD